MHAVMKGKKPCQQANFKGSAPSMETEGVKRLFDRSDEKHKFQYTEYYGEGDSKGFSGLEKIYMDKEIKVVEKECVGYVQKHVETALRSLRKRKQYGW